MDSRTGPKSCLTFCNFRASSSKKTSNSIFGQNWGLSLESILIMRINLKFKCFYTMIWMLIISFKKFNHKIVNSHPFQLSQTQFLSLSEKFSLNYLTLNFLTMFKLKFEYEGKKKLKVRFSYWNWASKSLSNSEEFVFYSFL